MADIKIVALTETTSIIDTDLIVVEDNSDTKKITKANFATALGIGGIGTKIGDLQYTEENVVTSGESITDSIDAIDVEIATHQEKVMFETIQISRMANSAGVQTISVAPGRKPKQILCRAIIHGTKNVSFGSYSEDSTFYCLSTNHATGLWVNAGTQLVAMINGSNLIVGAVENVIAGSFDISWDLGGSSGIALSMTIVFDIAYHD